MSHINTYTTKPVAPRVRCHDCGSAADIIFIPDTAEDATGYRGDLALCSDCLEKREAR